MKELIYTVLRTTNSNGKESLLRCFKDIDTAVDCVVKYIINDCAEDPSEHIKRELSENGYFEATNWFESFLIEEHILE